ncbi:MAG: alpha/beta hydrolase [Bacteroidales bacterium]|nr:alpha/beta hydrolase [Bacteroidales bacterium]
MKRLLTVLLLVLLPLFLRAEDYQVYGPLGGIHTSVVLPEGFNTQTDTCQVVILMHGFWVNSSYHPLPYISQWLAKRGIASVTFDFQGCGQSEGRSTDMTVEGEIADAAAVYDYVSSLPFVRGVSLLGHSQGGLVAGMLAGRLAGEGKPVESVILMAPAAVIRDYAIKGRFFGIRCNPVSPPDSVNIYGFRIGRNYILDAQRLDPYGETSNYPGPVYVLHGTLDEVVPFSYGEAYAQQMPGTKLYPIAGEGHLFLRLWVLESILGEIFSK